MEIDLEISGLRTSAPVPVQPILALSDQARLRRMPPVCSRNSSEAAWRPVSPARISLFVEMTSLFLITGNQSLRQQKHFGISTLVRRGEPDVGGSPCIFPTDQGINRRDEFDRDSTHRHSVCRRRDFAPSSRNRSRSSRDSAGFWWASPCEGVGAQIARTRRSRAQALAKHGVNGTRSRHEVESASEVQDKIPREQLD